MKYFSESCSRISTNFFEVKQAVRTCGSCAQLVTSRNPDLHDQIRNKDEVIQEKDIELRKLSEKLEEFNVIELKQFMEEQMKFPMKHQLSVIESCDLKFTEWEKIANGCSGVVGKIRVDVDEFQERTCTHCPIDELAIKMMFNFLEENQGTIVQKRKFDKEYIFPLAHPHWSHVQIFNFFRAKTVDALLDPRADKEIYADTTTYFTMELCESSLKTYIKENKGNISVSSALLMIYQILDGIKHLYDHKVVHLDLKDDNVFIVDRKKIKGTQVVIGDFGTIHPFIYKNHEASTPINRSPELFQFKTGSTVKIKKNDVWAAGCIFFQLLEGKHPFDDGSDYKHNICSGRLPLRDFEKKHGEGTKQFLKLLWNRDPDERLKPKRALGICGLLLWGAPNDKPKSTFDLQANFKTFCTTTCKQFSEQYCKQWLTYKINDIHEKFSQKKYNDELSFVLQVHFLMSISSSELLACMKILSTLYE